MLLSSGPLILIFEPRPVDRRTLLNDVERIVPLAVHIIKWLVLVLILSLATFPTIRQRFLHNQFFVSQRRPCSLLRVVPDGVLTFVRLDVLFLGRYAPQVFFRLLICATRIAIRFQVFPDNFFEFFQVLIETHRSLDKLIYMLLQIVDFLPARRLLNELWHVF